MEYSNAIFKWAKDGVVKDMAVDGTTPVAYKVQPSSSEVLHVTRLLFTLQDGGAWTASGFGGGLVLSNGINVQVCDSDDNVVLDLLDGEPIKTNAGFGRACYDVDLKTWGAGESFLLTRWTLQRAGWPLKLRGTLGEYLRILISDDLSGMTSFYCMAQGFK